MKRLRFDCIDDREQLQLVLNCLTCSFVLVIKPILNFLTDFNTSDNEVNAGIIMISIECVYQTGEQLFVKVVISY